MMLGNFSDELMKNGIKTYLSVCQSISDSPNEMINVYAAKEYLDMDLINERQKEIVKVTRNDIIKFAKKVYLDTIYLLRGSDNDGE